MRTESPREIRLSDYEPLPYRIDRISLHVELDPHKTRVTADLAVSRDCGDDAGPVPLRLDGDDLPLEYIAINGIAADPSAYTHDESSLIIHAPPSDFQLTTRTTISPTDNTALEGLYISSGFYCTQCEAEGFRRITFHCDRPDVLSVYTVTVDADRETCPVLLSNGDLVEERDLGDGRHRAVWHDPFAKPSYLFALVAGDLGCIEDRFTTVSGRDVLLRIWSEHGNQEKCTYAMDALKRSMRWDEERYGLEYDLDSFNIVAVSDFNMGAMENKSLNVFNSQLVLASPETATDSDYEAIEAVVAHEYFHNWTGNRVTCRDWFQLSLKEGLTVYRDQEFSSDVRSRPVKRIDDVRRLRAHQFPEDSSPMSHPVRPAAYIEINNLYTPTVYEKGAEVIRMMERILGREGFRKGLDLYIARHDGSAVTCDDFIAAMSDATGVNLDHFRLWYSQSGTPVISAQGTYVPEESVYRLTLCQKTEPTQGQDEKLPLHIPFEVGLVGPNGNDMEVTLDGRTASSHVLNLIRSEQTFEFRNVGANPVASLNRQFSAPVRIRSNLNETERAFLMAHDNDPFVRWESGQQFGTSVLLDMVACVQQGNEPKVDEAYIEAIGETLADSSLDLMFKARALAMPSESWLADQMSTVDPDAIRTALCSARRTIGSRYRERWFETYRSMESGEHYRPDAEQAGKRALRGASLYWFTGVDDQRAIDLLRGQFDNASNMTDRLQALLLLCSIDTPVQQQCLDVFHDRFRDDDLVIGKWLAAQAMSPLPGTLDRVDRLRSHESYKPSSPNMVYALIGAFASHNPVNFHRRDGAGYRFLADRLIEIDSSNPQVAARLVDPLIRWDRFDSQRRELMKSELRRIRERPNLSPDLYEKVKRSIS